MIEHLSYVMIFAAGYLTGELVCAWNVKRKKKEEEANEPPTE